MTRVKLGNVRLHISGKKVMKKTFLHQKCANENSKCANDEQSNELQKVNFLENWRANFTLMFFSKGLHKI